MPSELFQNLTLAGVATISAAVLAWFAAVKAERRNDFAGVGQRTSQLFDQLQRELARVGEQSVRYAAELEVLRIARFTLEDAIVELRDQAVAARAMVHEHERRLGLPETQFVALPRPGLSARAPPGPQTGSPGATNA